MLVYIVVAALPDNSGMDVARMNTVEDMPDDVARIWLSSGGGRQPTDEEVAAYRGEHPEVEDPTKPVDGPRPVADEPYVAVPAEQFDSGGDLPSGFVEATAKRPRRGDQPTEAE